MTNKKNTMVLVVIVIITISIAYYYNYKKNQTEDKKNSIANEQETETWQKYLNSKLKYSIQYPNDWILDTKEVNYGVISLRSPQRNQKLVNSLNNNISGSDLQISVYVSAKELPNNSDQNLNFQEWLNQNGNKAYNFIKGTKTPIMLNGVGGLQGKLYGDTAGAYIIIIQKDDYIYTIETGDTLEPTEIDQKIINSFRFL